MRKVLIAINLHLLAIKQEKQVRVDFLQRMLTVDGLVAVYILLNNAEEQELRRLSVGIFYNLIADSKELAKYVFDKLCKKVPNGLGGAALQPTYTEVR